MIGIGQAPKENFNELFPSIRLMRMLTECLELDPLSVPINRDLGYVYYMARQYDKAIDQERKTLELDPNFLQADTILCRAYLQKSMYKEGIAVLEKAAAQPPTPDINVLSTLGYAYAIAGKRGDAQNVLSQLFDLSKRKYVTPADAARIYIGLGQKDEAFAWLEKAYLEHSYYLSLVKTDPVYDPLRSDPRFADLLRRMNLQP